MSAGQESLPGQGNKLMVMPVWDHDPFDWPEPPYVTWTIIVINFGVFLWMASLPEPDAQAVIQNAGLLPMALTHGGLAGALPPAIGWAAATGSLSLAPILLVLIIFLWTPPHFWALALYRSDDYARAGVPMLPVVKGKRTTRRQVFAYALVLAPLALFPAFIGLAGPLYAAVALGFGAWLAVDAWAVLRETDETHEPAARRLFAVSIFYLFALFGALMVERLLALSPLSLGLAGG
jgi:heme o synthase